jgi:transglutaminase-like putative cysteine protease
MNTTIARRTLPALLLATTATLAAYAQKFIDPTPAELSMTSVPEYPGVAAIVLNKEEITRDDLHSASHYERVKILTDDGKKYANVELPFVTFTGDIDFSGDEKSVEDIQGRTIHPDGTIIPFTGKPYLKVIDKERGAKLQEKVFTLPDVTPGSIIEYRYAVRISDNYYEAPQWMIQGDIPVKSAHYVWYPTNREIQDPKWGPVNSITWFPILPAGTQIQRQELPMSVVGGGTHSIYDLKVKDIPPRPEEEFLPPTAAYAYGVYFNFSAFHNAADFWKSEGKEWSHHANSFANPNGDIHESVNKITAGATTPDAKLRAIYAAVMALENTNFTREHEDRENKANGLAKPKEAADVLRNGRGNSEQLTELFVAMARAAGFDADLMLVPDRTHHLFVPQWWNFDQFDSTIAIVNVNGKDVFFDPGSRFCPFAHLAWEHTFVQGLRQKGGDTAFAETPGSPYIDNTTTRIADLKMDDNMRVSGVIKIAYNGSPALRWRQAALRGDDESIKHELRTAVEAMLPHSLEIKDITVNNLTDPDHPLNVACRVEGTIGTATGKRLVVPADVFVANGHATFPHEKRDQAVYFHYAQAMQDGTRISFPASLSLEAAPTPAKFGMADTALYTMRIDTSQNSFTTHRNFAFNSVIYLPKEYPQLRSFYSQFEANDQQSVVLKASAPIVISSAAGAN